MLISYVFKHNPEVTFHVMHPLLASQQLDVPTIVGTRSIFDNWLNDLQTQDKLTPQSFAYALLAKAETNKVFTVIGLTIKLIVSDEEEMEFYFEQQDYKMFKHLTQEKG